MDAFEKSSEKINSASSCIVQNFDQKTLADFVTKLFFDDNSSITDLTVKEAHFGTLL